LAIHVVPAPPAVHVRPALELHQGRRVAIAPVQLGSPRSVWEGLWQVMHQQLSQDGLLLWEYDQEEDALHLRQAAPSSLAAPELTIRGGDQIRRLAAAELDVLPHVQCLEPNGQLEQVLADFGLYAAMTAPLSNRGDATLLVTCAFRQRWQLITHHAAAFSAFLDYLGECQRAVLPSPEQSLWWDLSSHVPSLWRQTYRPSVLRTICDLNEVLLDPAEAAGMGRKGCTPRETALQLACAGADLMARLESVYFDTRPSCDTDELLSQALLLLRGAYRLCLGEWPGCMAVVDGRPTPDGESPHEMRRQLVEWLAGEIETERLPA